MDKDKNATEKEVKAPKPIKKIKGKKYDRYLLRTAKKIKSDKLPMDIGLEQLETAVDNAVTSSKIVKRTLKYIAKKYGLGISASTVLDVVKSANGKSEPNISRNNHKEGKSFSNDAQYSREGVSKTKKTIYGILLSLGLVAFIFLLLYLITNFACNITDVLSTTDTSISTTKGQHIQGSEDFDKRAGNKLGESAPVDKYLSKVDGNDLSKIIVHFNFDETELELTKSEQEKLQAMAGVLSKSKFKIIIKGYSCNLGDEETNRAISTQRALNIRNLLISMGAISSKVQALGLGSTDPVAPNDSEENRRKNRRVIILLKSP